MIFVTGGTGFLGSYLLRYLLAEGHTPIRALKRANSPMDLVADIADQIEWIEGDLEDIIGLEDAMRGIRQIYHAAAVISYDKRDAKQMFAINVEGTENIVNAALAEGVEKMVYISSIAALGKAKDGGFISETTNWQDEDFTTNYSRSKHFAEMQAWRGIAEGLDVAILNPSVILGSGFWEKGPAKIFLNGWKEFPFYPMGGTGFVDVRDVARMAIQLMQSDISGERYVVSAENMPTEQLMRRISDALGKKQPSTKVTRLIGHIAWRVAWLQGLLTGKRPFITREIARQSSKTSRYDNRKSITQLQFEYTPLERTIQETCEQLRVASEEGFKAKSLPL